MRISANFDSGNIDVIDASDPSDVRLAIRPDAGLDHRQWFHFRVSGARGVPLRLRIVNANACSYPTAWPGYRAVASVDRERWSRVDTTYVDGELVIEHVPEADVVWFAYFAPYSHERHQDLVAWAQSLDGVTHEDLGPTVDGRDLDLLILGTGPRTIWVIARQHPGESMAEWWMEGFLHRLLDADDALAKKLLGAATFYVVPNMNPDGSVRGHLRNNAAGANLNREWESPSRERSPEVLAVRDRMDQTGVDLALDVHGDEELPYNFIAGAESIPGWTDRMARLQDAFCRALEAANPDFQRVHGYPPGPHNFAMCTDQLAQRFDCLAMTLEQPFKDTADTPDAEHGWSPARAARLGASGVDAIAAVVADLR
jgi:murein tripeptide amidase MpaA